MELPEEPEPPEEGLLTGVLEGPVGVVPLVEGPLVEGLPGVGGFDASIVLPARSVTCAKSVPGADIEPPEILEK
jgi:hypothetical protein